MVVLSTTAPGTAAGIAKILVGERLAACVNITPVRSTYRWQGALVEEEAEELLTCKTVRRLIPNLVGRIRELHPYRLPEVIALPVGGGHRAYLEWVRSGIR
jgi:periplasmic divalent cation tolerance protein